ncbi:hypothetical protein PVAND_003224 [Polypedilum vanderplanki]|uniref:C2H2-type domain-containing protein n=1 Tax=Polypedilum vanderplanki TaxID=319348 RepID=A0A9J6BTF2_POLVA|nr:hypothetical protein PVAND_003224 [Polypedilum vanderplanki]
MGRKKGSVNSKSKAKPSTQTKLNFPVVKKDEEKPVAAVPILEAPLMIFVCRRCHNNFDSTELYQMHNCPAQLFAIVETDETRETNETITTEEKSPEKSKSPQNKDETPKKSKTTESQQDENDNETIVKEKKPRKPYKKREKKKEDEESKVPIACEKCGKSFTRKYHLERHLTHTQCNPGTFKKEEFNCEVCGKVFSRVDNLRMHLRAHLGQKSRSRDFQCPYCEKSFYGSSLLNIHIRSHTREKPYLCDWENCGKGFPSSGALTKHRRTHTGERPYECKICGNRFAAKETLNRHTRTHTGRRDHVCRICGKSFIQNTQLRAHMFHHTGEHAYTCDLCGKQFNRKTRMREHLEYIHLEKKMPTCNMCSKTFMRREDLSRHIESHIGERNHTCSICDKKFVTKAAARIHMRIHQVEDPARCNYCNKDFLRMDCLVRHVRSKHRDMLQQIIVEAETNRIISAQQSKISDVEELEIIVYNEEDSQDAEARGEVYEVVNVEEVVAVKPKATTKKVVVSKSEDEEDCTPIFLNDDLLMKRIQELLQIVIEESLLKELGFGKKPIDEVLCSVLEQCSHKPLRKSDGVLDDDSTRMRENTKQLFSMVLDEEHIKSLLNNYTVDEVITIVLKMAK